MSILEKYIKGLGFRTNRPSFDPGDEVRLFVTGFEDSTAIARVGDSVLRLPDVSEDLVDSQVDLRVESFDTDTFVGEATRIETTDGAADESSGDSLK